MSEQKKSNGSNKRSKHSKLEKQFYSERNFNLLEGVLLDMVDKEQFTKDHKSVIFHSMENVYKESNPPRTLPKSERKRWLSTLNKKVLALVASHVNSSPPKVSNHSQQSQHLQTQQPFQPAPEMSLGQPLYGTNQNTSSQFSIFPGEDRTNARTGKPRELKTFYAREFTQPVNSPSLHPSQHLDNFPAPTNVDSSKNFTNVMFTQREQERSGENAARKPKPIDFALPQNTKDDINPENKFKELMRKRETDDDTLRNKLPKPKESNIPPTEQHKFDPIPSDDSFFIQNKTSDGPRYNSFMDGLDENLLNADEIVDVPQSLKKQVPGNNDYPPSRPPPRPKHSPQQINNQPTSAFNSREIPKVVHEKIEKVEKEPKTIYLTVLSKYRNSSTHPSPTNFSIPLVKSDEKNIVKIDGEIIFKYTDSNNTIVNLENINNILSVECLDVVVPKCNTVLREPYIWLCVSEWGSSNIGTGVPEGAFARLKQIPGNSDLPFITMRAHILERQRPDTVNTQLTFRLLTSDGEPFEIKDRVDVINIKNKDTSNIIEVPDNHDIKENDMLYVYSLYTKEVIGFYPNVYVHGVKVSGKSDTATLSLRLFIDTDPNNSSNKIGTFADDADKKSIIASKYLSIGDLLFLEYTKTNKITGQFKIIDIKNDIITIKFPQKGRKFTPKKITRIGFIKKKKEGYVSHSKEDINYKGGVYVTKVDKNNIYVSGDYEIENNEYFLLKRKSQTSYMFRITYFD